MKTHFTKVKSFLSIFIYLFTPAFGLGQSGGYEASWGAGIWSMNQNPAATTASVYKGEFTLGMMNLSAGNNRFATNNFQDFFPSSLVRGLSDLSDSQPFTTDISHRPYVTLEDAPLRWNAGTSNKFIGPGGYWRLDLDADWVERGLSRMSFSMWLERSEVLKYSDIDESFVDPITRGLASSSLGTYSASDNQFSINYREWDALAINYGLSVGKGNKLFHIAFGGKLLSAGSFMDLNLQSGSITVNDLGEATINAKSIVLAYNPSFESGLGQGIDRRFKNFEYSWGVEGNIGLIYQSLNYNREPVFEAGFGVQGIGGIQYWNLNHQVFTFDNETVSISDLSINQPQVSEFNRVLTSSSTSSSQEGPGVTEKLPLSITLHAKHRINSVLGLQIRALSYQVYGSTDWNTNLRGTFCIERTGLSFYLPVTYQIDETRSPHVGLYIAIKNGLIIGSEDVLSNLYLSATRQGVTRSNLFIGLHFPIKKDY